MGCDQPTKTPSGLYRSIQKEKSGQQVELDFQIGGKARYMNGPNSFPCYWSTDDEYGKVVLTSKEWDAPAQFHWEGEDLILMPDNLRFEKVLTK